MRLKRLLVSPSILEEFLLRPVSPGITITSNAPKDLRIIYCEWTGEEAVQLIVESAEFELVDVLVSRDKLPFMDVYFTQSMDRGL